MGHIRNLSAGYSLFGLGLGVSSGLAGKPASRSKVLRQKVRLIGVVMLASVLTLALSAFDAGAQPRSTTSRAPQPALPPSGHQTEPVDLNEGKSPAELFQAGCSVCHQSPAGLAKGRREGELVGFLRQHYTSGVQHAAALASFIAARGGGPATAAPVRQQAPIERPPAPIGRRTPEDDRKPQEAARPAEREREPAAKRKPPVAAAPRTPPSTPTASAPAAAEAAVETGAGASVSSPPPVEEKPAPPEIPL
jgi:hypothetical protein